MFSCCLWIRSGNTSRTSSCAMGMTDFLLSSGISPHQCRANKRRAVSSYNANRQTQGARGSATDPRDKGRPQRAPQGHKAKLHSGSFSLRVNLEETPKAEIPHQGGAQPLSCCQRCCQCGGVYRRDGTPRMSFKNDSVFVKLPVPAYGSVSNTSVSAAVSASWSLDISMAPETTSPTTNNPGRCAVGSRGNPLLHAWRWLNEFVASASAIWQWPLIGNSNLNSFWQSKEI